jgi:hypothetical protein
MLPHNKKTQQEQPEDLKMVTQIEQPCNRMNSLECRLSKTLGDIEQPCNRRNSLGCRRLSNTLGDILEQPCNRRNSIGCRLSNTLGNQFKKLKIFKLGQKTSRRSVSFLPSSQNQTYLIPTNTDAELEAVWYSDDDYHRIRKSVNKIIHKMDARDPLKKKYCERGLEHFTDVGYRNRRKNKKEAMDAVLDEQLIQWHEGIDTPTRIATIYTQKSQHCQAVAVSRAKLDAIEVKNRIRTASIKEQASPVATSNELVGVGKQRSNLLSSRAAVSRYVRRSSVVAVR